MSRVSIGIVIPVYIDDFYTNDQVDQGSVNMKNGGYETEEASMSYIGRFTYDYMSRYLVEFAFREDGSYRYAPGARWGFFPVVSGYRIEEKFIKDNLTFIDNLKLRASYGTVKIRVSRVPACTRIFYYWWRRIFICRWRLYRWSSFARHY